MICVIAIDVEGGVVGVTAAACGIVGVIAANVVNGTLCSAVPMYPVTGCDRGRIYTGCNGRITGLRDIVDRRDIWFRTYTVERAAVATPIINVHLKLNIGCPTGAALF